MHFTLWPGLTANVGAHTEIDWPALRAFVSAPAIAADRTSLEGWSPARFAGNRRGVSYVEAVSCIVLDDDSSGLATEALVKLWSVFSGLVHTSHSHTPEAPRHRIILQCSRNMNVNEHAIVWRAVLAFALSLGQPLDEATKDPSRLWFVPARRADGPYEWRELTGEALDVDAVLAAAMPSTPTATPSAAAAAPNGRRKAAMAAALGSAWPDKGRHGAQLALAGALRAEGFSADAATDFLCDVCRLAGDEDRPKRIATVAHTWAKPAGSPLTGWTALKRHIDPVVVEATRASLGRDADWTELAERRIAATTSDEPSPATNDDPFAFRVGGLNTPLPPITYQVDGLIAKGDVVMLVAHGNSLKTWLAFSLALAVASGRPWLGRFPTLRGVAGIIDFESGAYEVDRRLQLLGARDELVEDRLLRTSYPAAKLTEASAWLRLAERRGDLWVVDSFTASASGTDENDARAAEPLQHAARLAETCGCTVVFIHHARKSNGGTDRREAVRGSSAIYAACDRVFEFTDLEKKDGGIVMSTMTSIKDGAGRTPEDVRVELSDKGIRWVEIEKKKLSAEDAIRHAILLALRDRPQGYKTQNLKDLVTGKASVKVNIIATLKKAEVVSESGPIVYLNPAKSWEEISRTYGVPS